MKTHYSLLLALAVMTSCAVHQKVHQTQGRIPSAEVTTAMFSPWNGKEAFEKIYQAIQSAKHDVKVSVYSWSDSDFDKAIETAVKNGVNVRVVLHPDLAKKKGMPEKMVKLETMAAKGKVAFKVAPRNMHEKFLIVDGEYLMNTSANMSSGAKNSYSENFVFTNGPAFIIENFENEFAVIWNSGKDVKHGPTDVIEDRLPYNGAKHQTTGKEITLYSSSMNYNYIENATASVAYNEGKYIKLQAKGGGVGPYTVRDAIISAVKNAKKNVYCSFNHFNIKEISDALLEASKRGVDVKLTVDNQEFRERFNPEAIEMTPHFVENWKKIAGNEKKNVPVRVKWYSHAPNPTRWLLNHHKFLLVDYDAQGGSDNTVLVTGSYNLSETAEHNQFDNMVTFRGTKYAALQKSFLDEFNKLWSWERSADKPNADIVKHYTTVSNGVLPIHHNRAVSLTWEEIFDLRSQVRAIAPEFLRQINRRAGTCSGYNVTTKQLVGCTEF
jgi:phosphatidylserine/phosphatidylglycerophosphate/cardiolipin synthase-like enzyme